MSRRTVLKPDPTTRQSIDQGELREVLSNLSHELRRPLVSLKSGFELLIKRPCAAASDEEQGHLKAMVGLCDDLLRLTSGYLDYAAIIQGGRPILTGEFSLGALVDEIDRQFAPLASERGIGWNTEVCQPEAVVTTDAMRFQQIVGNLVSNALKYTPSGGLVSVIGRVEDDGWSITVEDNGPGIPEDAIATIFEPFYRLPRDEHSSTEGSGLGLAICRELTAQLGGRIEVESIVGGGVTMQVHFPIQVGACGPGPAQGGRPQQRDKAPQRLKA